MAKIDTNIINSVRAADLGSGVSVDSRSAPAFR
jgi:hypothetical protein